jgi:hypothetical protein
MGWQHPGISSVPNQTLTDNTTKGFFGRKLPYAIQDARLANYFQIADTTKVHILVG